MKTYSTKISLTKNSRGIYSLDTSIGCTSGMQNESGGCYGDCYAAKSAKIYGYDFGKTVLRSFENEKHRRRVMGQINRAKLDFIRIGCSGDPSEDWSHTVSILKKIDKCNKQIVIITRHWTQLTDEQLAYFAKINICVNTSVSALDKPSLRESCLEQYRRLNPYCKSILRVVSCDFNLENPKGFELSKIQHDLFKNEGTLDTVLRVNKNNPLVSDGVIKVKEMTFLGQKTLASKLNKKTFFGKCSICPEMCGVKIDLENKIHPQKPGIVKQGDLFKKTKIN